MTVPHQNHPPERQGHFSPTLRQFILLFAPIAVAIAIVSTWFVISRNQIHTTRIQDRQDALVALESQTVAREIASLSADIRFLARLTARQLEDAPDNPSALRVLSGDFADFARSNISYFQIRFLSPQGMERVRINRTFAGPVVVPEAFLQEKTSRYYFREALALSRGEVHISRFDLNIEHGEVELPFRPTLRFSSPVLSRSDRKLGVVVLNFDGGRLLELLRQQAAGTEGAVMLLSRSGHWMLAPQPDMEWGHVIEERKHMSMPELFPEAWEFIKSRNNGHIFTKSGLFSFNTLRVDPNQSPELIPRNRENNTTIWKIVTQVRPDDLSLPWIPLYAALTGLFTMLLAAGSWFAAEYRIRQRQVEAQLRENEERTLAISQSAQDAIVMVDDEDRIIYWNPAAERLLGYTSDEIMGQEMHPLLASEADSGSASTGFREFRRQGRGKVLGHTLEVSAKRKSGGYVPVELAISAFHLKDRWYAVGSMRNMTRRKEDEAKLRRSEETARALLDALDESAFLLDLNGIAVSANEAGARLLNLTPTAIIGSNVFELLPRDVAERQRRTMAEVLRTTRPIQSEETINRRIMLINTHPAKGSDGKADRVAVILRDVTAQRKAEAALRQSEQRFRDVSQSVGEFIWETNADGRFTFITSDVEGVLAYSPSEITGHYPEEFMPKADVEDFARWRDDAVAARDEFSNIETRFVTKGGEIIWLQLSGVPYFDEDGKFSGYRGAGMNITDRKRIESTVKASERKLRALAESAYDAIVMIDFNGRISFWNHAAEKLFGYTEQQALGQEVHDLVAPEQDRNVAKRGMFQFAITGKGSVIGNIQEVTGRRKDGSTFPAERSVSAFRLSGQWYAVATIRDITDRKQTEARLRELATTDSLTNLFNRRRFMELAQREFGSSLRYGRSLSLFMMDIDHFKKVNDTYGHDVGDEVLRGLAATSAQSLRKADVLGRLGGEEFAVLLPETGMNSAMEVAERLRIAVENSSIATQSGDISITVSIGVATLNQEVSSVEILLKNADIALYQAKQTGRNKVVSQD
ncbi:sensor domain-containing diguanylate cyclase [Pseudodesulfovibrio tunisiensis]|uniref:sensor domain-containing diguanylate cyclase n=1 Tax=Pseudodesulfovibrio tunisiensis TaxID=463192 RepID=UPI001FB475B7|nr:PAS domain S-box protein [Pseudodesulfovibrio tunisiensis]